MMHQTLRYEYLLLRRNPAALAVLIILPLMLILAMWLGAGEIARQEASIERFRAMDAADREALTETFSDWGGAAYGSFHATWNPPGDAAFLAIGQRDLSPWLLRIRALALEGQIHESDDFNPLLSLAGRLDTAFVLAYLLPIALILLLYDLVAAEREAGRLGLLLATVGRNGRLWRLRVGSRLMALLLVVLLPLWLVGLLLGASPMALLQSSLVVLGSVLVWTFLVLLLAFRPWPSALIAMALMGLWMCLALLLPLAGKVWIDRTTPGIDGAQIALLQRETVNAAWDLPREDTMTPFYASHPEWAHSAPVDQPFHWKWYYAFQQVGDEAAAPLSTAYRDAIRQRDRLTRWIALLSPPVATMRVMQRIADTDTQASLAYDARIRDYHEQLRRFYYPYLFDELPFDAETLSRRPEFQP